MKQTHAAVTRLQNDEQERIEGTIAGYLSHQLWVGDAVLVRREPTARREGPLRFQPRAYPGVYRIAQSLGPMMFRVADIADPEAATPFL